MAIRNDVSFYRGEDVLMTFTLTPVTDITAWTISCRVKASPQDTSALLTIAGTVTSAAAGIFTVPITAAQDTTTLQAGSYPYAVVRTDSGSIAVLSEGVLTIKPTAYLA
jgi:hypothetical protein